MAKQKKTMKMKKIYIVSVLVILLVAISAFSFAGCTKADYTVGIIQLLPHGALDKANQGFQTELTKLMKEVGKTVKFDDNNAQGDQSNNGTIAQKLVNMNVDLIYAIATPSAQAAAVATSNIPVIFNAVTDPVDAGLVNSATNPGKNVSGCSDMNPIATQVALMKELVPTATKFGVLYTASETNSQIQANMVVEEARALGVETIVETIQDLNDLSTALGNLKNRGAQCVYIPTDNVLADAAQSVHTANTTGGYNLPIVCGEGSMNDLCGVATYGLDYYELGVQAAKMAFEVLYNQADISTMPVRYQTTNFALSVNTNIAQAIGFTIPQSILDAYNN